MEKIKINLLPEEFLTEKKVGLKRSLYIRISIIIFMTGLIITSAMLIIRLTQSQELKRVEAELEGKKTSITSLKDNESTILVLKSRLDKISKITAKESVPVQAYNLMTSLIPTGAHILNFSMTKDNTITVSVETLDTNTLDQLFTNLLDQNLHNGYLTGVKLENIRLQAEKISVEMEIGYSTKAAPTIAKAN